MRKPMRSNVAGSFEVKISRFETEDEVNDD